MPDSMSDSRNPYRLYGVMQSFFTRKVMSYLDYKGISYEFNRKVGQTPRVNLPGWPGGIPAMKNPEGDVIWDSTSILHHLELKYPEQSMLPPDPVNRFLCYILEDLADEWCYRLAVGSRWYFEENTRFGGFMLADDLTYGTPFTCDQALTMVTAAMRSSCGPFGVTEDNAAAWMDDILKPLLSVLGAHLEERPFLFGDRPSLADFALFGGNAAHFINDPLCRRWVDEFGPAIVQHTHKLTEPWNHTFGDWADPEDIPETLINLLADLGNFYLPWVSEAVSTGKSEIVFKNGQSITIEPTDFLKETRGTLLLRYKECRTDKLDAILDRAGILSYYADYESGAGSIPDYKELPQPMLNRPYPTTLTPEESFKILLDMGLDPAKLLSGNS